MIGFLFPFYLLFTLVYCLISYLPCQEKIPGYENENCLVIGTEIVRSLHVWLTMTLMVIWECNVHRMKQLKICLLLQGEKSFSSIVNGAV